MSVTVALRHHTRYAYDRPVEVGPQLVRLRPAPHARAQVRQYGLKVSPGNHFENVQQDPFGNFVSRIVFPQPTDHFSLDVELLVELTAVNPFDFFLEESAEHFPFEYEPRVARSLDPFLVKQELTPHFEKLLAEIPRTKARTVNFLVDLNARVHSHVKYVVRMEPGVLTPEQTLERAEGSCRDSAYLLVQILRHIGIAARFVSGYLIQLVPERPPLDGPAGPTEDFCDLHAWAEAYIPGAGWIGLDATSGLLAGEGHIPLAATPEPEEAAPVSGSFAFEPRDEDDTVETEFAFAMSVERVVERPTPSKPYEARTWEAIETLGDLVDARLAASGEKLTMGGEPTFVCTDDLDGDEWNTTALGPTKRQRAEKLAFKLRDAFAPKGLFHFGQGKWYPGEPLPRWAITLLFREDGEPMWRDDTLLADEAKPPGHGRDEARWFVEHLAERIGVGSDRAIPAFEDAFYYVWKEGQLPVNVDPYDCRLDDPEERARLARVFAAGLGATVGYVLPLECTDAGVFRSGEWKVRGGRLRLTPGDSPMGYRLPLDSLPWAAKEDSVRVLTRDPFEPVGPLPSRVTPLGAADRTRTRAPEPFASAKDVVRTALCVEPRNGVLYIFLPPFVRFEHFIALIGAIEETADTLNMPIRLEGYLPPFDPRVQKLQITPDPGVIEVNVQPTKNFRELTHLTRTLYEAARKERLTTEKHLVDGRRLGSGGGDHIVMGGATPAESPFLRRPELLASLIAYMQCHPALSYMFSGLFIGPTSQHPRVDEARTETRIELETALAQVPKGQTLAPWLVDRIFRHLLVDVTGNTHRTEICIDKLYSPDGPDGRRGLVELRAFEAQPTAETSLVLKLLVRALVARFLDTPFDGPLARWGTRLLDDRLMPHFVWQDFREILRDLASAGMYFAESWFEPHFERRFPRYGSVSSGGVTLEMRMALEPWNVLGEESSGGGTVRFVDSSVERAQLKVSGITHGRHVVAVNGHRVPMRSTGVEGEQVGAVRFRAWQPSSCLHPTVPVHAPLVVEIVDLWAKRPIASCTYHVSHPGGRSYAQRPVNELEAEARREERFVPFGTTFFDAPAIARLAREAIDPDRPLTLDLMRKPA